MLEVMETYVVCFGQLDEFLDSERVVWILVGVLQKRHLAELLFDVVDSDDSNILATAGSSSG